MLVSDSNRLGGTNSGGTAPRQAADLLRQQEGHRDREQEARCDDRRDSTRGDLGDLSAGIGTHGMRMLPHVEL
jgi:hypothetical protein